LQRVRYLSLDKNAIGQAGKAALQERFGKEICR
jgi:hypothetical protein